MTLGLQLTMEAHTERRWVCKEPTTQYGWVRLGMESINSHKSGWRSHTLTVLLILSIPMAWAARCALECVQKSTHTQLREESYAQYHSHKYIVYINIYATTHINQDSVSDTQQRKRSTKNQACKRNVALPSHSPQFNSPTHPPLRYIENGRRETIKEESFEHRGKWLCARPLTTVRLSHPPDPNCGTND